MAVDRTFRLPLALLAMVGFVVGLLVSFWVAGLFGFSPALLWSAVVLFFLAGVFLLERPKVFLYFMFLYHSVFWNGILFGQYYLPVPFISLMDEAILAVPLAIIAMKAVNRLLPKGATYFPLAFVGLAALSHVVNDALLLNMIRVTLSYSKFYIFWYFTRALGPWTERERKNWLVLIVLLAVIQFPMNVLWQRHVVVTIHADASRGTIGNAHLVGYLSLFTLFMLGGWLLAQNKPFRYSRILRLLVVSIIISYNLIFLTDTKHVLFLAPFAAIPFFLYPRIRMQIRIRLAVILAVFGLASYFYIARTTSVLERDPRDILRAMQYSGKGAVYRAITTELHGEVPLAALGAGPGNFCSWIALTSFRPLANKYVLPYMIKMFRSRGASTESSVIGSPITSFFTLWGEFGPITTIIYFLFWFSAIRHLWRLALRDATITFEAGQRLALICSLIVVILVGFLIEAYNMGALMLPLWVLVGMYWEDTRKAPAQVGSNTQPPPAPKALKLPVGL